MSVFVFKRNDNINIHILNGESIDELKAQNPELNKNYSEYNWKEFCDYINNKEEIINPNIDFLGKDIVIYYIDTPGRNYPEKGYYFIIDGKKYNHFVYKTSVCYDDLTNIFRTLDSHLKGEC